MRFSGSRLIFPLLKEFDLKVEYSSIVNIQSCFKHQVIRLRHINKWNFCIGLFGLGSNLHHTLFLPWDILSSPNGIVVGGSIRCLAPINGSELVTEEVNGRRVTDKRLQRTQAEPRWWGPHGAIPKLEVLPKVGSCSSRGKRLSRRGTATRGRRRSWDLGIESGAGRRKAAGGGVGAVPTCFPPRMLLVNSSGRYLPGSCLSVCISHKIRIPWRRWLCFHSLTPSTAREFPRPTLEGGTRHGVAQAVKSFEAPGWDIRSSPQWNPTAGGACTLENFGVDNLRFGQEIKLGLKLLNLRTPLCS